MTDDDEAEGRRTSKKRDCVWSVAETMIFGGIQGLRYLTSALSLAGSFSPLPPFLLSPDSKSPPSPFVACRKSGASGRDVRTWERLSRVSQRCFGLYVEKIGTGKQRFSENGVHPAFRADSA